MASDNGLVWVQSTDDMITADYMGYWLAIVWCDGQAVLSLLSKLGGDIGSEAVYPTIQAAQAAAIDHAINALASYNDDLRCRYCGAVVNEFDCLVCAKCLR